MNYYVIGFNDFYNWKNIFDLPKNISFYDMQRWLEGYNVAFYNSLENKC